MHTKIKPFREKYYSAAFDNQMFREIIAAINQRLKAFQSIPLQHLLKFDLRIRKRDIHDVTLMGFKYFVTTFYVNTSQELMGSKIMTSKV